MENSVIAWLDEAARNYPHKIAFKDGTNSLNFTEFNLLTKHIGSYLAEIVSPNSPVVVLSGRHVMTPACFLGVVRAGCFYAPMDASMPISRLNQILGVIQAEVMLVDRDHIEVAQKLSFSGRIVVLEDILDTEICDSSLNRASVGLTGSSPLYVIFTSGSTGIPKGVITSQHSLMCYIDSVAKVLGIDSTDNLGGQAPLDYIAAVRDIYLPLRTGATTVILPKNEFSMPVKLFETLNKEKVTTICWSVAGIELPVKLGAFDVLKPEYVNKVCFSGSVMPCRYLKVWQQHLPNALFVNQYGPTEATASCTYYVVREQVEENTVLPIGVPYENYGILLLNEDNTQPPSGEIGEICVKGPILALGYYGDPLRTAQSFMQNPLNSKYRELIYKTGDLGRFRGDGNLEFHGRKDRQIKHMGHRIELGEIESTAIEINGIEECCALYNKEKELLYLFYTGLVSAKEIALHFRCVLPAFMVPRKIVKLDTMPRLPNGKMDMQSLKAML